MQRSKLKNVLFGGIMIIILLVIIEGLLSIYFYQKTGPEKLASIESLKTIKKMFTKREISLNVTNHNLVRPDSSEKINHNIAEETVKSNKFVYESWVEFRNGDFDGEHMKMKGLLRKSDPSEYISPASHDTLDIYFMGGSTMFGFNVVDYETIPSQFLQLYKEKYPNGKAVRVHNFGIPTYYSYQELILLSNLIYNGGRPNLVIFLDGINDFWFIKASYYRQSYFSFIFRQVFNRGLRSKGEFQFLDTTDALFTDPKDVPLEPYYNSLIDNYVENMKNSQLIAGMTGAKCYYFLQPSPFYNYPNQQKDPMCFKDTATRFNYIYPRLEKMADSLPSFTYLGNMLLNETGYPFVDGLHYSPKFIRKITERIFASVEHELTP